MIFGYGYADRKEDAQRVYDDLVAVGAERAWVDYRGSDRAERADLFGGPALRRGSVVVLLSRSQLGYGKEAGRFEAMAAAKGATIEVREPAKPSRSKPGPSRAFQPTYDQEREIRHYWHGPFKRAVAVQRAREVMGYEVSVASLNRHLGPRSIPREWINERATDNG
jgi:hypothetical protein